MCYIVECILEAFFSILCGFDLVTAGDDICLFLFFAQMICSKNQAPEK